MKFSAMLSAGAALTVALSTAAGAAEWRGWNIHPPTYPNGVALDQFAENVTEGTDGDIQAQVFHNGVLGNQPDAIQQLIDGSIEFANFNLGPMGEFVPAANVVSLPFIFKNTDQMYRLMDGEIGDRFAEAMREEGIVALSWFGSGSRSFYNSDHPIQEPSDMEGMKVRVMNNDLYVQMVDQLGGNATPMAFAEVYQALNNGTIDAAENNYPSYESTNHYEVAPYYSITNHLIIPECVCVSAQVWEGVSEENKEVVRQAAQDAAETQRQLWAERAEKSLQTVKDAGSEINEVNDPSAFQEAMTPIYEDFKENNPDLAGLVEEIRSADAGSSS